jgi:hypothetical protein
MIETTLLISSFNNNLQKHRVFTFRDVVFSESTKCLELTKIESPTNLPLDLDSNTPYMIEQNRIFGN